MPFFFSHKLGKSTVDTFLWTRLFLTFLCNVSTFPESSAQKGTGDKMSVPFVSFTSCKFAFFFFFFKKKVQKNERVNAGMLLYICKWQPVRASL